MSKEAQKLAREALKNLEPENPYSLESKAIKALEEALASEQEQGEPVAWMRKDGMKAMVDVKKQAWIAADDYWSEVVKDYTIPLYTTPQPAQKPLTDEQIMQAAGDTLDVYSCARAIEAAHGIKE